MKKIISILLCFSFLSSNFVLAQAFEDNLAKQLDKNLKVEKAKYQSIKDDFAINSLNQNLKVKNTQYKIYEDEYLIPLLDKNLTVKKQAQTPIVDNLVKTIDKSKASTPKKQVFEANFDGAKIKVSPIDYHTTRENLAEGDNIDFILVEDIKIGKTLYKKGTKIPARVETLSKNGAYGVPADLVVGNFTLPNKTVLNGQIAKQGANRSLWVYPIGYTLSFFFFIGLPIFAIRGGHVKLKPHKVYEVEI